MLLRNVWVGRWVYINYKKTKITDERKIKMSLPQVGKIYTFTCMVFPDKRLNLCGSAGNGGNVAMINADENEITIEEQWKYHSSGKLLTMKNTSFVLDRYAASGTQYNNADVWTNDPDEDANQIVAFEETIFPNTVKIRLASTNLYLRANAGDGTSGGKSTTSTGNAYWDVSVGEDNELWVFSEVGAASGDEEDEIEGQKLVLPIKYCKLTASYKNAAYEVTYKGDIHYGIDIIYDRYADPNFDPITGVRDRTIRASGNGEVIAKGWDTNLGNVIVIKYPNAYHKTTGTYKDVIIRYCHLNSIDSSVVEGASVNTSTVLGVYGGSGKGSMNYWNPHLHIETDEDTEYPCYSPTFATNGEIIYGRNSGANDSTMSNPLTWLYVGNGMTYTTAGDAYINSGDEALETI